MPCDFNVAGILLFVDPAFVCLLHQRCFSSQFLFNISKGLCFLFYDVECVVLHKSKYNVPVLLKLNNSKYVLFIPLMLF